MSAKTNSFHVIKLKTKTNDCISGSTLKLFICSRNQIQIKKLRCVHFQKCRILKGQHFICSYDVCYNINKRQSNIGKKETQKKEEVVLWIRHPVKNLNVTNFLKYSKLTMVHHLELEMWNSLKSQLFKLDTVTRLKIFNKFI